MAKKIPNEKVSMGPYFQPKNWKFSRKSCSKVDYMLKTRHSDLLAQQINHNI